MVLTGDSKKPNLFRKAIDVFAKKNLKKTSYIQSESSSVGAQARALSDIGDPGTHHDNDDLGPDNTSALSTGTYIITNVGRKMRAALCSSDRREGVVASLDGTNVVQEAGDEWIVTHHGGDSMYRIQNKRYATFAGSIERPLQSEPVDISKSIVWFVYGHSNKQKSTAAIAWP